MGVHYTALELIDDCIFTRCFLRLFYSKITIRSSQGAGVNQILENHNRKALKLEHRDLICFFL